MRLTAARPTENFVSLSLLPSEFGSPIVEHPFDKQIGPSEDRRLSRVDDGGKFPSDARPWAFVHFTARIKTSGI
jgi:hypothetical protein